MTDRDPLAAIEETLNALRNGESRYPTIRNLDRDLRTALAEARQAVDALTRWKAEALPVLDGLQEIGKALGLPLGARITGPQALAAINALVAERDAAREALARVEAVCEQVEHDDRESLNRYGQHLPGSVVTVAEMVRDALAQPATDEEADQ